MSAADEQLDRRSAIALRNRRRLLEGKLHKLIMAIGGLMAYSAFGNIVGGIAVVGSLPWNGAFSLVLGGLYVLGTHRVWNKDDVRWWPVAVPAGISIAIQLLAWFGGALLPGPLLINAALLVLVPIRARASTSLATVSNDSMQRAALPTGADA